MSGSEIEDDIVSVKNKRGRKTKAPARYSPTPDSKKRRVSTSSDDSDDPSFEESKESSSASEGSESEKDKGGKNKRETVSTGSEDEEDALAHSLGFPDSKKTKQETHVKTPVCCSRKKKSRRDSEITCAQDRREMKEIMKALTVEVRDVNAKVDDLLEKPNRNRRSSRKYLPDFPLKTGKDFIAFEKKLEKTKVQKAFVKRPEDIGGCDSTHFVRNIFARVLDGPLIEKFSMTGQLTEKCPFEGTKMCEAIIEAVTSSTGTEAEVRKKIMIKLQHAKGDNLRAKKRAYSINVLETLLGSD